MNSVVACCSQIDHCSKTSLLCGLRGPSSTLRLYEHSFKAQVQINTWHAALQQGILITPLSLSKGRFFASRQVGGRTGVEGPDLSKWQRGLWGLGTVFLQYVWARLDQIAAAQHWGDADSTARVQQAWTVLRSCETALHVASLLNFLVFLRQGKYRQVLTVDLTSTTGHTMS